MKSTITNAAEITVLQPIDNNYKTGGGDISIGGCVVVASKGKPFTPTKVYGGTADLENNFGTPLPKKSFGMQGLRQVHDASEECSYVNVIRVVNELTYRYPSTSFMLLNDLNKAWESVIIYKKGDIVTLTVSGVAKKFIALEANNANESNKPGVAESTWREMPENASAWVEGVLYGIGDLVTITGSDKVYVAVEPHTAAEVTKPGTTNSPWKEYDKDATCPEWSCTIEYAIGDVVTESEEQYVATQSHVASEANKPGVTDAPWAVVSKDSVAVSNTHRWNETIALADSLFLVFYPIDGDTSVNRSIAILDVDDSAKSFTVEVHDKDELGEDLLLETHIVGISEDDKDDMGVSAYIETVFERNSDYLRADFVEGTTWEAIKPTLLAVESTKDTKGRVSNPIFFVGGTTGDTPTPDDFNTAIDVFRNERVACNLLFAAGIGCEGGDADYSAVLRELADIADERHIAFFYDIPGYCKAEEALEWNSSLAVSSRHARAYYSPFSATDQWRGGTCVWGVSGAMAAAKARANKIVTVGSTPGVHYSPAGESRSYLNRSGVAQVFPEDKIDRDEFYDARINPVVPMVQGGCCADDDLTQWFKTNYLRFGWINDVLDYIDHRFVEAAAQVKFEPDGITQMNLYELTTQIMEDLVTSGALVTPRDSSRDGTSPYVVTVEQLEIDLWKVTWEVCITGAARRIAGQPKLIR